MADSDNNVALGLSEGGSETVRLRLFFLAPLTLVIMVAVGLFVSSITAISRMMSRAGL